MSPAYNQDPGVNTPVSLALEGQANFAMGSGNLDKPTVRAKISNVVAAAGTATLTVTIIEGNIPAVGQLITVKGTASGGGALNVTNVSITGVSITPATGQGTISFASGATISSTADGGTAYVPPGLTFEALPASGSSQAYALPRSAGPNDNQMTINWQALYGTAPATTKIELQISDIDQDSAYATIDTSTNVTGETRFYSGVASRFIRFKITTTGASPTGVILFWI